MEFNSDLESYPVKFIVLGDSTVGKTALINRYVHGIFNENGYNTIGISVEVKKIVYKGKKYEINIWDTAGQERYRSIISRHYKQKHGIVLTIDLNDPNFENVDYWLNQITLNTNNDMPTILVGTKKDLRNDINLDTFKSFAESKELPFIATSAKSNDNVDVAFESLLNEVLFRDVNLLPKNKNKECFSMNQKKGGCC